MGLNPTGARAARALPVVAALAGTAGAGEPPYPASAVVARVVYDRASHRRGAPGSDNWPSAWCRDGHLYAAWGDGGGFGGTNKDGRVSLGVARIEGPGDAWRGVNVWGGLGAPRPATFAGKSYGMVCVGGVLAMWRCPDPLPHYEEARLAISRDRGASWRLVDWAFRFEDGLVLPTFLDRGKDNGRAAQVYSYFVGPRYGPGRSTDPLAVNGFHVNVPGEIFLGRAPAARLAEREAHELFAGLDARGRPIWTKDLARKAPVFRDPAGVGWNLSVVYAPGLRRYLLSTEHGRTHRGSLGLFDAPEPWGPWTTVEYVDGDWAGFGHTFFRHIPSKWISADGRRFTMVWTGIGDNDSFNTIEGRFELRAPARR